MMYIYAGGRFRLMDKRHGGHSLFGFNFFSADEGRIDGEEWKDAAIVWFN